MVARRFSISPLALHLIYPVYLRDGARNIMTDENGKMYDYGDGGNGGAHRPTG